MKLNERETGLLDIYQYNDISFKLIDDSDIIDVYSYKFHFEIIISDEIYEIIL
jgi:hypothetical protein